MEHDTVQEMIFEGDMVANWKRFIHDFENYRVANEHYTKSEKAQVAHFKHCMGEECVMVCSSLNIEHENYQTIKVKLAEYFNTIKSRTMERYHFDKRFQESNETISTYIKALQKSAKNCEFGDHEDERITDRLVVGVNDDVIRKLLLKEPTLTFDRAVQICQEHTTTISTGCDAQSTSSPAQSKKQNVCKCNLPASVSIKKEHDSYSYPNKCCKYTVSTRRTRTIKRKCGVCRKTGHNKKNCPKIQHCCQKVVRSLHQVTIRQTAQTSNNLCQWFLPKQPKD